MVSFCMQLQCPAVTLQTCPHQEAATQIGKKVYNKCSIVAALWSWPWRVPMAHLKMVLTLFGVAN